jgi:hypothetical protein
MTLPGGPPQPAYRRMGLPELLVILAIILIVVGFNRLRGGNRRGGGFGTISLTVCLDGHARAALAVVSVWTSCCWRFYQPQGPSATIQARQLHHGASLHHGPNFGRDADSGRELGHYGFKYIRRPTRCRSRFHLLTTLQQAHAMGFDADACAVWNTVHFHNRIR